MAQTIFGGPEIGKIDPASTDPRHYAINNGSAPYTEGWSGSASANSDDVHSYDPGDLAGVVSGVSLPTSIFSGQAAMTRSYHHDFHFRLWVVPNLLQLSNPQLNTDIPFYIWNSNDDPETISSIVVTGSDVLSFDLSVSDVLRDFEYREVNLQIGEGEANIDASVSFVTEELTGILSVLAQVSDTFNLIPDVPVKETWEFKTDIIRNIKGVDQRISLRRFPRVRQDFEVEIIDLRQRREQYELLRRNIKVQSLVPFYQYATNATDKTEIGGNEIFCDTKRANFRVGSQAVAINPTTEQTVLGKIETINAGSIVLNSTASFEIDKHWIVMPAENCIIENDSGITMQNVTGRLKIASRSFSESSLLRPSATRTIDTFDGVPFLNRRPLIPAKESFEFKREILDNSIGRRDITSKWLQPRITGLRKFTIQRNQDPEEMDYWRSLFDTVRGGQKSFLFSTWLPDLTLSEIPEQGDGSIDVKEGYYTSQFFPFESYKRIQIEYEGNLATQHVVSSSVTSDLGIASLGLNPGLPDDPLYDGSKIMRISFLKKVRASDRVVLKHYAGYSEISFGIELIGE